MSEYDEIISDILVREGGATYTNRPNDRGGPTKYGITQATLSNWRKAPCTPDDVKNLTEREAREIYAEQFIFSPKYDRIADSHVRHFVIDSGVNSGTRRATQWLQTAAGVTADGIIGPMTLAAVNSQDPIQLFMRLVAERITFLGRLITRAPRQAENAHGWMNRVAAFLREKF